MSSNLLSLQRLTKKIFFFCFVCFVFCFVLLFFCLLRRLRDRCVNHLLGGVVHTEPDASALCGVCAHVPQRVLVDDLGADLLLRECLLVNLIHDHRAGARRRGGRGQRDCSGASNLLGIARSLRLGGTAHTLLLRELHALGRTALLARSCALRIRRRRLCDNGVIEGIRGARGSGSDSDRGSNRGSDSARDSGRGSCSCSLLLSQLARSHLCHALHLLLLRQVKPRVLALVLRGRLSDRRGRGDRRSRARSSLRRLLLRLLHLLLRLLLGNLRVSETTQTTCLSQSIAIDRALARHGMLPVSSHHLGEDALDVLVPGSDASRHHALLLRLHRRDLGDLVQGGAQSGNLALQVLQRCGDDGLHIGRRGHFSCCCFSGTLNHWGAASFNFTKSIWGKPQ